MAYLEEFSLRSSETFRQWFKKLQCIIPGNFTRNDLKPNTTKLLQLNGEILGDDLFPSQKNLDVIMNTLRRDLVNLLRKSESSSVITLLIYKLNILDNNIREVCRYQHTWENQTLSSIEALKVQEKYIIRLIEEIMDNIFDAYSTIRRRLHHFSFNERNINGIISVLGILKREVCNMIHVITVSVEQHHKRHFYETICAPPNANEDQYIETTDNEKTESQLPIFYAKDPADQKDPKASQASLPTNRSYPFIERNNERIFSSLHNICFGMAGTQLKDNSSYFSGVVREGGSKGNCIPGLSKMFFSNNDDKTNGRGDADKNHSEQNGIRFASIQNTAKLSYKEIEEPDISKTVNTYFSYAEKNKSSLLSYNKDYNIRSKINNENRESFFSRKNGNEELNDDSRAYLCQRTSMLSWPSATVVREIKSEINLESSSKYDHVERTDNYKDYYSSDESLKDVFSDSDSDESYISCAVDGFQFGTTFLDYIKEKYLQDKSYKKTFEDYADRNNTKSFSCKSSKLSEIFAAPKIIQRQEDCVAEVYHSVESLPTLTTCIQEMRNAQGNREAKNIDVGISTDNEVDFKGQRYRNCKDSYQPSKKKPVEAHRKLLDSFNTLALSEDCGGYDARFTESIISFASVATETVDMPDKSNDVKKVCSYKSIQQQRGLPYIGDAHPNLEDSQYSSVCLALPPSRIRLVNIGNEVNLLAIEVEQT